MKDRKKGIFKKIWTWKNIEMQGGKEDCEVHSLNDSA